MTEEEWLASVEPVRMLKASRSRFRHRKLRLFAVACCRLIWESLPDPRSRRAVEVAELYADDAASDADLRLAAQAAGAAHHDSFKATGKVGVCLEWAAEYAAAPVAFRAAKNASWMAATPRGPGCITEADYPTQAELVRDIFESPFRPVAIDPAWLTWNEGAVVRVARTIYEEKRFDALPNLAGLLQEAGCDNEDILAHCEESGRHVKGCWVIDLLLSKE